PAAATSSMAGATRIHPRIWVSRAARSPPPPLRRKRKALLVVRLGLRRELVERVTDAHLALHRRVQEPLGVRAELRVPDRRARREERRDMRQLGVQDVAALELAAVGELLDRRGAAGQAALGLVDRDGVLGPLPPLDARRRPPPW